MTFPKLPLAGTLLTLYAVYSCFVPVSIPHSIILFSLAGFAAFEQYINSHKTPSIKADVEKIRLELFKELETTKEIYEQKLADIKSYQSKQAIEKANAALDSTKKTTFKF